MQQENIITVPPRIPVKRSAPITIPPPKPPISPGLSPSITEVTGAPPAAVDIKAKEVESKHSIKPRAVTTDPKNTVSMLANFTSTILKTIPLILKKYWWIILIIAVVWVCLMIWDPITLQLNNPNLAGLINAVDPIMKALGFLTAAYTHFVSKTIYVLIILRVILPLARRIKNEGFKKVIASFMDIVPGIKGSFAACVPISLTILLAFIGIGLILSNLLTLNNMWIKVLVPIALAFSMVKTLSDGKGSISFMTTRVVTRDIGKLFKKKTGADNNQIFLAIAGVMIGLVGTIILAILRNPLGDTIGGTFGYILGGACIIAGIVLYFVKGRAAKV